MFYHALADTEIARQIAVLVNQHNGLAGKRRDIDILESKTKYMVETHGKHVIGAVGTEKESYTLSEIKHLVVHPKWRHQGLGKYLTKRALRLVETPMAYCTIREDNKPSIRLFESIGFSKANAYAGQDHNVVLLTYASPTWKNQQWINHIWKPDWYIEETMALPTQYSQSESWISMNNMPPLSDT